VAIVVCDMDQAFERLRALKCSSFRLRRRLYHRRFKAAAESKRFIFANPDQHNLEIIYFPPGKGDPRWQEKKR